MKKKAKVLAYLYRKVKFRTNRIVKKRLENCDAWAKSKTKKHTKFLNFHGPNDAFCYLGDNTYLVFTNVFSNIIFWC